MFDFIGALQPNCNRALDLVDRGIERPLSLGESLRLKYNSGLCPYCSCQKDKFNQKMQEYQDAKRAR